MAEIESELAQTSDAPAELGDEYRELTLDLVALGDPASAGAFAQRVESAREAARRFGDLDGNDLLRVEVVRAQTLLAHDRADEGELAIVRAIEAAPSARRVLASAWQVRGEVAIARCEVEAALAAFGTAVGRSRVEIATLEAVPVARRTPSENAWLLFHSVALEGALASRADALVRTGRLDQAAIAIEEEARIGIEIEALAPDTSSALMLAQSRAFLALASEDFEAARDAAEEALARLASSLEPSEGSVSKAAVEPDPELAAIRDRFTVVRASAEAELAREGRFDATHVRRDLDALLARTDLDRIARRNACFQLADLATSSGDVERAARALDEIEAMIAAPDGPGDRCARDEETARTFALRARLALASGAPRERLLALRDALASAYARVLDRWARDRPARGGIGHLHFGTSRLVPSVLIRLELALDPSQAGRRRAVEVVLQSQAIGTLSRRLGAGAVSLERAREVLCTDGVELLVWLPALDRSHVFRIGAKEIEHAELGSRDVLLDTIEAFAQAIAERPAPRGEEEERAKRLEERGAAVRDALLPREWREKIDAARGLYVSGIDLLANAPLECIPWEGSRSLGAVRAICHVPSIPAAVALAERERERGAVPSGEIVLVAAPALVPVASDPKRARFEIDDDEIEATWPASDDRGSRTLAGERANARELAALDLGSFHRLEIVTHGVFDPSRELPAGLALAPSNGDGGVLWSERIEALSRVPPLVALWACGSARGQTRLGDDGAAHLAASFLLRDADVVVVNRGNVTLRATLAFAREYDRELGKSAPPAEALRAARSRLIAGSTYADPWYHGGTVIVGLGFLSRGR